MSEQTTAGFDAPVLLGGKKIRGRFVIPSGIRCTRASTIQWCFSEVPSVGVVTTKSISHPPRAGYREPIYARYAPESYINAVGLSNPGAESFRRELEGVAVPDDKFLLVSIFGGNVAQFVQTAEALKPVADGFELNMSCPHAEGYGVEIGQNRDLVATITEAVVRATGLPVIVKLSAVVGDVGLIAKAAVAAGAAGITVSNTIGPATVNLGESPILSNKVGGLSGTAIRPLALRSIKRVRDAIGPEPVLIGMGGVARPDDVRQFLAAGANLVGVGSALTGMNSAQMRDYFEKLNTASAQHASGAINASVNSIELPRVDMGYFATRLASREVYHPGLYKLTLEQLPVKGVPGELGGRYFFLFVPGVGEKPFAIFSAEEKSVVIRIVGKFTQALADAPIGAPIYLRGPYGRPLPDVEGRPVVMVGGGTGIASVLEIGLRFQHRGHNQLTFLLGGRTSADLFDIDKFAAAGTVRTATDDGTAGHKGFVSELLAEWVTGTACGAAENARPLYVLCGPEPMVQACFKVLSDSTPPEDIWASIEYMTSCGVGICGKCASPGGHLTCIDGPFLQQPAFESCLGKHACTVNQV
jgi:dihydroorotate dehydrogenase (NAD+) catalytic subunit